MKKTLLGLTLTALATTSLLGCSKTEEGAATGALIGALAGQAIGGDSEGTLIGAGAGALIGGAMGNDQDKRQRRYQRTADGQTIKRTTTHETLNPDGSITKTGTTTTTSTQTSEGYTGLED